MAIHYHHLLSVLLLLVGLVAAANAVGVNYGTFGDNLPPPTQVANFLKTQTVIDRIKIFDTNPDILRAFANTGISVTVSVLNKDIPALTKMPFARQWVAINIAPFYPQTKIIRVLVGNEVLHSNYNLHIVNLVPAMRNLHAALQRAGFRDVKVSTPHSLGILETSDPPSTGRFRPMYTRVLVPMLQFLRETKSEFLVSPYPYFGYTPQKEAYATFRPNKGVFDPFTKKLYTNMFDGLMDAVYSSMKAVGYADVPIVVAESGWPSQGGPGEPAPTMANAISYNGRLLKKSRSRRGTPLMPNRRFETYIFALFQENQKPGPVAERNFGLFWPDFTPVYKIGILRSEQVPRGKKPPPSTGPRPRPRVPVPVRGGKQWCVLKPGVSPQASQSNLDYACSQGVDCKPIQPGGPCFDPNNVQAHASFAMNSYYQTHGRQIQACDFAGTGMLTSANPSRGACRYL